jgi:hypothetical protein
MGEEKVKTDMGKVLYLHHFITFVDYEQLWACIRHI